MEAFVEEAATYEKCLEKIKSKYGPNIVITRTETQNQRSFFGLFEKDKIKLTFSIRETPIEISTAPLQTKPASPEKFIPPNEEESRLTILQREAAKSEKVRARVDPYLNPPKKESKKTSQNETEDSEAAEFYSKEEVKQLAQTVEKLAAQIASNQIPSAEHENIVKITEILEENDFTPKYIRSIKEKLKQKLSLLKLDDFDFVQKQVINWIADSIKIKPETYGLQDKGRIISLVGPTGNGKTTTLTKLAAYHLVESSRKLDKLLNVQIITIDGYRIGATFQIKKYCEHMNMPLAIAERPGDLKKYLDLYKDSADIICIDTTGRSPSDYAKILEMQRFFEFIDKELAETHLVVSAIAKANDIKEIIKQYKPFEYGSLIVTKLDETKNVGSIISVLDESEIPVSFVTTGQNVPKDFQIASKNIFLKKLNGFTIDMAEIDKKFNDTVPISWEKKFW